MAKTLCGGAQNAVASGSTGYTGIGLGIHSATTIETLHDQTIRTAGTFSNLSCTVKVQGTGVSTIRLRKNLANANQSISIPGSTTGFFEDISNTDSVTAGDLFDFQNISGSGGVTTVIPFMLFEADGNTTAIYGGVRGALFSTASATRFIALEARLSNISEPTEADAQTKIKVGGTWKNMDIKVSSNARSTTTTFKSRINGVDGNMLVSIPAVSTGHFEDTSNTDSVSADDLINLQFDTGTGAGGIDVEVQKTEIEYSGTQFNFPSGTSNNTVTTTIANVTNYVSPIGGIIASGATEADSQIEIPILLSFSNLLVHVINNNITVSDTTVKVRKNGADGNGLVSIPAGATGFFEDTSNSDSFGNGDKLAYEIVTPNTAGEIGISMISTIGGDESTVNKTFAVNSILEPTCDADFCDNFNDFAFQKLPTFRDNFNYPTQSSADANWSSSDLPQIRVNAQTEVIDYDWTQSNAIEALSFDLSADTVSKEKWTLRFKFVLNSFTKADASPNLCFIGLATNDGQGINLDGEGIGFQCEVRTVEPVDFNLQHRDDATSNKDLVGNIGGSVLINVSTGTFFVEVRRESANKAVCNVYSDAQFTTLLGSGSITMNDLTSDLRHILIVGRDNNGMNLMDGTIDDLEFWNGGQQGDRTFEDNFKQKTVTFTDDFSTPANFTTFGTDVSIAGGVLSALDDSDGTNHSAIHVLPTPLSDTKWVMRFRLTPTTLTAITSPPFESVIHIGAFDADHIVGTVTPQDMIAFTLREGVGGSFYDLRDTDGAPPNITAPDASSVDIPSVGVPRFVELVRTSATTYQAKLFLDPGYTDLIDTITGTCSATTDVMPFVGVKTNMNVDATAVASCDIDDLQVWNGVSSITDWILGGGTDVAYNTTTSRVDFDIPISVDRDELIAHDLQSSLGVNADDENWTLRFKLDIDSITQGSSEEASTLFVGLDSNLDPTASATHDLIALRISIDQGGAGPQFGVVSSIREVEGGAYFAGGSATNFPFQMSTGTRFVEIKRLSSTLAECTLFTDADYTTPELDPNNDPLTVQVTVADTLDSLRYIRVTTDSSAVANDSPWDGSIDDIEFYNGVSVSRTPFLRLKDHEDDFTIDNFTNMNGTRVSVNTGTEVMDWASSGAVLYNDGEASDPIGGTISTTDWTLRCKLTVNTLVNGADASGNDLFIGFGADNTTTPQTGQDYIGWRFSQASTGNSILRLITADGTVLNTGATPGAVFTSTPQSLGTGTFYLELKRSGSVAVANIYSDKDFTTLIERQTETIEVGITGLRFIKIMVSNADGTADSTYDGVIDDLQFWDGQFAKVHENIWRKVDE